MTRIAQSQLSSSSILNILRNHADVVKYGDQISSGYKVSNPGDSDNAGAIAEFRETIERIAGYKSRIDSVKSFLTFQDDLMAQATEVMNRAKELASQGANETLGASDRVALGQEVLQIRNQLVTIANSNYHGRYVYNGNADSTAPYNAQTYTNPSSGDASLRYVFGNANGSTTTRSVKIADNVSVVTTTAGNSIFDASIQALDRLGRALVGYKTGPTSGTPDGTGAAYTQPDEFAVQTADIQNALNLLNNGINDDILPERVDLGARLKRIDTVSNMLDATKNAAQDSLNSLQNADTAETATSFQQAQFALQASLQVSAKILNLSVLDYL